MADLLSAYREDLLRRRKSRHTVYQYLRVVEYFLEFAKGDFSRQKVLDFIFRFAGQSSSSSYLRWLSDVLSSFFKRAKRLGFIQQDYPISPEDLPKLPGFLEVRRPSFSREEVLKLISFAKAQGSDREKEKPQHRAQARGNRSRGGLQVFEVEALKEGYVRLLLLPKLPGGG